MKKLYFLCFVLISILSFSQTNVGITGTVDGVYINEFHYSNANVDDGEFVEVAGPAGTDLSDYTITLYNDSGGVVYKTIALSGTIDDEGSGLGAVMELVSGFQNGAEGIALSKTGSTNIQFLSYSGTLTAVGGAASGLLSVDIGVSESSATPIGYSLEYDETLTSWTVITDDTPDVFAQGTVLSNSKNRIEGFNLYPNPSFSGFINISSKTNATMEIAVYDMLGKRVINKILNDKRLDVSYLNTGIYILKVSQNEALATKKLVIK